MEDSIWTCPKDGTSWTEEELRASTNWEGGEEEPPPTCPRPLPCTEDFAPGTCDTPLETTLIVASTTYVCKACRDYREHLVPQWVSKHKDH